ncbi:hypothetical protein D3C73_1180600 [compost metagenome]
MLLSAAGVRSTATVFQARRSVFTPVIPAIPAGSVTDSVVSSSCTVTTPATGAGKSACSNTRSLCGAGAWVGVGETVDAGEAVRTGAVVGDGVGVGAGVGVGVGVAGCSPSPTITVRITSAAALPAASLTL